MTVENYLAGTGVLAGFSLVAVIQLLAVNNESKLATAGIIVFSAVELNAVP